MVGEKNDDSKKCQTSYWFKYISIRTNLMSLLIGTQTAIFNTPIRRCEKHGCGLEPFSGHRLVSEDGLRLAPAGAHGTSTRLRFTICQLGVLSTLVPNPSTLPKLTLLTHFHLLPPHQECISRLYKPPNSYVDFYRRS